MIDERKMAKQPPPASTASTVGRCLTLIQITKTLEVFPAPSHHPTTPYIFLMICLEVYLIILTFNRALNALILTFTDGWQQEKICPQ